MYVLFTVWGQPCTQSSLLVPGDEHEERTLRTSLICRRGSTPASVVLRKSVRFFVIDIFLINNKKNFPRWGASSKVNGTNQYPVWMTQKPRKGDFRGLKSKKPPGEACPRTPLKACAFGAHLGNRSVLLLDPRLVWNVNVSHSERYRRLRTQTYSRSSLLSTRKVTSANPSRQTTSVT